MLKLRSALITVVPIVCLSLAPVNVAMADGFAHGRGFGHGFGPFGAINAVAGVAAAIVTIPLAIIAATAQNLQPAPAYGPPQNYAPEAYYQPAPPAVVYAPAPAYGPPQNYAPVAYYPPGPPPGYAPAPQVVYSYGPPPGYYGRAPVAYGPPRGYYHQSQRYYR